MSFEGLIATPFGYLIDGLYRILGNYGLTICVFAVIVQAIMVPIGVKNRRDKEKKRRLKPMVNALREEYKNDSNKQAEMIAALYDQEKISLVGSFILSIIPFFVLIPIFQVVAQPITYMFHETPETSAAIIRAMREVAPELFTSGYHQVTAISHIQDYKDIIKEMVPEASARTLNGLNYSFLGLNLGSVPGVHVIGKDTWAWDWAHIGLVLLPIIHMGRRIYNLVRGMVQNFVYYKKEKKAAKEANMPEPTIPAPPLMAIFFLLLSLTALFSIPVAMNCYWLAGGIAATLMHRAIIKYERHKALDAAAELTQKTL